MISTTIASLVFFASPQDAGKAATPSTPPPATATNPAAAPDQDAPPPERFVLAEMLPQDSLAVLSVAPLTPHRVPLLKSGLEDLRRFVGDNWKEVDHLSHMRLSPWDFPALAHSGFSLAITGVGAGQLNWVLVAPTRTDQVGKLRRAMLTTHEQHDKLGNVVRKITIGGHDGFTVTATGGCAISYVVTDTALVIADSVPAVERALAQRSDVDSSFVATRAFANFTRACTGANQDAPFASVLLQPALLLRASLGFLPNDAARAKIEALSKQLGLHQVSAVGMSLFTNGEQLRDFTWVGFPAPRSGLLGALLDAKAHVQAAQLAVVAPDAISVNLFSFDLGRLFDESLATARLLHPSVSEFLRRTVETMETGSGRNWQRDLLPRIGPRAVLQELPREGHWRAFGLTVETQDGTRLQSALEGMAPAFGFRKGKVGEVFAFALPGEHGTYTLLTVQHDTLICSNSPRFVVDTVARLAQRRPDASYRLAERVHHDGQPAHLFRWGDSARLGREWTQMLGIEVGHRDLAGELGRLVRARGGSIFGSARVSAEGIALRTESPFGNPRLTLTAAFLLRLAGFNRTDAATAKARRLSLLRDLLAAQYDYQHRHQSDADGDRIGEFGDLAALIDSRLLSARRLTADADGAYTAENYRVRVFLPKDTNDRELSFLALAWPAPRSSGPVYAMTADGSIHSNDILGQTDNLQSCDPRDFYDQGRFGGEILPSWQLVETIMVRAITGNDDPASDELTAMERASIESLEQAAESRAITPDVLALLESKSAFVTARAAKVMGELRHRPAIESLIRLVHSHGNAEVKRQAMTALVKMRDQRTVQISIEALTSPDAMIRTQAAQNLGYLHATDAVAGLVGVLAIDPRPDAPDRNAALLALADIGDASCLLPAAARVKQLGEEDQRSLTYLFQTLSTRQQPRAEAEILMAILDHPSELLRRYAIQRLGILALPVATRALTQRLTKEKTLRDLVEVSLENIRQSRTSEKVKAFLATAKVKIVEVWDRLPKHSVYAGAGAFVLFILLWRRIRRRRRLAKTAERFAAMVAPSDEFEQSDYQDGVEYYDEDEYPEYDAARGTEYIEFDSQQVEEFQDDPLGDYFVEERRPSGTRSRR